MGSVCLNPVKRYLHYLDVVSPPPIRAQHLITYLPSEPMRGQYLMETIVQSPHPPVLSFMSGNRHYSQFLENRKVSEFSKIENISILENETRKLMDTH